MKSPARHRKQPNRAPLSWRQISRIFRCAQALPAQAPPRAKTRARRAPARQRQQHLANTPLPFAGTKLAANIPPLPPLPRHNITPKPKNAPASPVREEEMDPPERQNSQITNSQSPRNRCSNHKIKTHKARNPTPPHPRNPATPRNPHPLTRAYRPADARYCGAKNLSAANNPGRF